MVKKYFNKNIIISVKNEEKFQWSNEYWLCKKLFTDKDKKKVRDHDQITGKYRAPAHWNSNINLKLTKNVPVVFHNLRGCDGHLIMHEISNFDV